MTIRVYARVLVATAAAAVGTYAGSAAAVVEYPPAPATVQGHVYFDENANGQQDPGEPDAAGVDLAVLDADGVTTIVTTDSDGNWSLLVPPGPTAVDLDETTLPDGAYLSQGTDVTDLTLGEGETADPILHGYATRAGEVRGHIYFDSNGDGDQDPGEPDLSGVAVEITPAACSSGGGLSESVCPPIVVVTDANGDYSLIVPAGETTVDIDESTLPTGVIISEGSDVTVVTVVDGETTRLIVNGYRSQTTVTVPGTGSDFTAVGVRAGVATLGLGLAMVAAARRRRQPVTA